MQNVALGNDVKVELGPNWVQGLGEGTTQNPIYTLALKNKLVDVFSDFDNVTTFDNHGPVDMDRELDAFDDAFATYLIAAGALAVPILH
jgi:polyamine oxidase